MKKTISLLAAATALLAVPAIAATKEAFTCEKIKDKVVRESCVESRGAEKTKGSENQKFVIRAKEALTHNFKDPGSAQFANLILVTDDVAKSKTLCGTVNAKNSYGGYVGAKTFYVRWTQAYEDDNLGMTVWMNDGSESGELLQSGINVAKMWCGGSKKPNETITSVN